MASSYSLSLVWLLVFLCLIPLTNARFIEFSDRGEYPQYFTPLSHYGVDIRNKTEITLEVKTCGVAYIELYQHEGDLSTNALEIGLGWMSYNIIIRDRPSVGPITKKVVFSYTVLSCFQYRAFTIIWSDMDVQLHKGGIRVLHYKRQQHPINFIGVSTTSYGYWKLEIPDAPSTELEELSSMAMTSFMPVETSGIMMLSTGHHVMSTTSFDDNISTETSYNNSVVLISSIAENTEFTPLVFESSLSSIVDYASLTSSSEHSESLASTEGLFLVTSSAVLSSDVVTYTPTNWYSDVISSMDSGFDSDINSIVMPSTEYSIMVTTTSFVDNITTCNGSAVVMSSIEESVSAGVKSATSTSWYRDLLSSMEENSVIDSLMSSSISFEDTTELSEVSSTELSKSMSPSMPLSVESEIIHSMTISDDESLTSSKFYNDITISKEIMELTSSVEEIYFVTSRTTALNANQRTRSSEETSFLTPTVEAVSISIRPIPSPDSSLSLKLDISSSSTSNPLIGIESTCLNPWIKCSSVITAVRDSLVSSTLYNQPVNQSTGCTGCVCFKTNKDPKLVEKIRIDWDIKYKDLSRVRRRCISIPDDRPTAICLGSLGITVLVFMFLSITCPDIIRFINVYRERNEGEVSSLPDS